MLVPGSAVIVEQHGTEPSLDVGQTAAAIAKKATMGSIARAIVLFISRWLFMRVFNLTVAQLD